MGSDRYFEARLIAQDNFWPARSLLVRAEKWIGHQKPDAESVQLVLDIREFLKRTEQT